MVSSAATTVDQYLAELPPERREVVEKVRKRVAKALPKGYVECMTFGMIGWVVPLSRYPNTYNKQPIGTAALAAQKNGYSLYVTGCYMDPKRDEQIRSAHAKAGKKLDMGKSCIRFKTIDAIELDAICDAIASISVDELIALYEKSRA